MSLSKTSLVFCRVSRSIHVFRVLGSLPLCHACKPTPADKWSRVLFIAPCIGCNLFLDHSISDAPHIYIYSCSGVRYQKTAFDIAQPSGNCFTSDFTSAVLYWCIYNSFLRLLFVLLYVYLLHWLDRLYLYNQVHI